MEKRKRGRVFGTLKAIAVPRRDVPCRGEVLVVLVFPKVGRGARLAVPVGLAFLLVGCPPAEPESWKALPPLVRELVRTLDAYRPVEPRLTGFRWAPCQAVATESGKAAPELRCSSLDDLSLTRRARFDELVLDIDRADLRERTVETLWAKALVQLVRHDREGNVLAAVENLRQAAALAPEDPRIASDLAAAEIVLAGRAGEASRLGRALGRLLEIEALPVAGLFNRAWLQSELCQRVLARESWEEFRSREAHEGWRLEALERWDATEHRAGDRWEAAKRRIGNSNPAEQRRLVSEFPQSFRELVLLEWLPAWGASTLEGSEEQASAILTRAVIVSRVLAEETGDLLALRTTLELDRETDSDRLASLARSYRSFEEGYRYYRRKDEDCRAAFFDALKGFRKARSPFAAVAGLYLAIGEHRQGRHREAWGLLAGLEREHAEELLLSPSLRGFVLWMKSLVQIEEGRPGDAHQLQLDALERFERQREHGNVAAVHKNLGYVLSLYGDSEGAWNHLIQALRGLDRVVDPWHRYSILVNSADAASAMGEHTVALGFAREVTTYVSVIGKADLAAFAHWRLAVLKRLSGFGAERLREDWSAAAALLPKLDGAVRAQITSGLALEEGLVLSQENPRAALSHLDRAVREAREVGSRLAALFERARVLGDLGDHRGERRDLEEASKVIEDVRKEISADSHRISFFELGGRVFERLLESGLPPRGPPGRSFHDAERGKARALLDLLTDELEPIDPATLDRVREAIPGGTALVQFAWPKESGLVRWIVTENGPVSFSRVQMPGSMRLEIEGFLKEIRSKRGSIERRSCSLFDSLVRPVLEKVPDADTLIFVSAKELHGVPWAALKDCRTGKYLAESHKIGISPSSTVLLHSWEARREKRTRGSGSVLFFGNPAFDRTLSPGLGSLLGAESESDALRNLYEEEVEIWTEDTATKARFLARAAEFEILHLSVHARPAAKVGRTGHLLLAPSGDGDSGILTGSEVARLKLRSTRLVILSACATASGPRRAGEGVQNLARPFLAAGAPVVLATLWPVEDRAAAEFSRRFHRYLRDGEGPYSALAKAQQDLLAYAEPAAWAGFVLIGGEPTG